MTTTIKICLKIDLKSVQKFYCKMEITDVASIPHGENFADLLTRIKSHSSLNIVLLRCQWKHPIQQLGSQEELHSDSVVKKGKCRDMNGQIVLL